LPEYAEMTLPEKQSTPSKYWAFVSYNKNDRERAHAYHKALERYRIPFLLRWRRKLPSRLYPIFLDDGELACTSSLADDLKAGLENSACLVVFCSPNSAEAPWVQAEVEYFQSLGRGDRIYTAILAGEPNSPDPKNECLVPALRTAPATQRQSPLDLRTNLGADFRPGSNLYKAKLRLIAAIIRVDFEELWRRDRARNWVVAAVTTFCLAVLITGTLWGLHRYTALDRAARIQRHTELGRQEFLSGDARRALPFLADAYQAGSASESLRILLGQALDSVRTRPPNSVKLQTQAMHVGYDPDARAWRMVDVSGSLRSVDAATGQPMGEFPLPLRELTAVAFSSNGQRVALAAGKRLEVWDTINGRCEVQLTGHELDIRTLVFGNEGRWLVSGSVDDTARLWDLESGSQLAVMPHGSTVTASAFSSDGQRIVTGCADGSVLVWDARSAKEPVIFNSPSLEASALPINEVGISPDGRFIAARSMNGRACAWRTANREIIYSAPPHKPCLAFSFDVLGAPPVFALTPTGGTIEIIASHDGSVVTALKGHSEIIMSCRFSTDGRFLISSGADGTAKLWSAVSGRLLRVLELQPTAAVIGSELSAGNQFAWTMGASGELTLWHDVIQGRLPSTIRMPLQVSFSRKGDRALIAGADKLEVWDVAQRACVAEIQVKGSILRAAALSPDSACVAAATMDESTFVWSASDGKLIGKHPGKLFSFSADGRLLLITASRALVVVDAHSGRELSSHPYEEKLQMADWLGGDAAVVMTAAGAIYRQELHPEAQRVLIAPPLDASVGVLTNQRWLAVARTGDVFAAVDGGDVILWRTNPSSQLHRIRAHERGIVHALFDSSGDRLVTIGADGFIRFWDKESGRLLQSLASQGGIPSFGGFTPTEAVAATANSAGHTTLWDVQTSRPIAMYEGSSAAISPDGRYLLLGGEMPAIVPLVKESREPELLASMVERITPWRLNGGSLVRGASN